MKMKHLTGLILLVILLSGWTPLNFVYITRSERLPDGSRIPIPGIGDIDRISGRIFSNDTLLFKGGSHYNMPIYSAQPTFLIEGEGEPEFDYEPEYLDPVPEYQYLSNIRSNGNPYVTDWNGRKMTWIRLKGDGGIDIFQYPLGSVRQESLYCTLGVPSWQAIFVDGQVEIEGTLTGALTIGSSGDMWLIDDVRYTVANRNTGDFNEGDPSIGLLALASERDIIIENNLRNGKGNGLGVNGQDWNRHSIVITAALYCANGSFTFEHQNDDWEMYQGPSPDERGTIYLKGNLFQGSRGVLHNSNHDGTGFRLDLKQDHRFERRPPPYLNQLIASRTLTGFIDTLDLDTNFIYYIHNLETNVAIIKPEYTIRFIGEGRMIVHKRLEIIGSDGNPLILQGGTRELHPFDIIFEGRDENALRLEHVVASEWMRFSIDSDSASILNCDFQGEIELSGKFDLRNSSVGKDLIIRRVGDGMVERNLITGSLEASGYTGDLNVRNNTFIGTSGEGVRLRSGENVELVNNVLTGFRRGIVNDGIIQPRLSHNLLYDISLTEYEGCQPDEGSLSTDPLFADQRNGDYSLSLNSPCIDAGDPASPRDPDGTVADIGAYWLDRGLGNDDDEDNPPYPPFNRRGGIAPDGKPKSVQRDDGDTVRGKPDKSGSHRQDI